MLTEAAGAVLKKAVIRQARVQVASAILTEAAGAVLREVVIS